MRFELFYETKAGNRQVDERRAHSKYEDRQKIGNTYFTRDRL